MFFQFFDELRSARIPVTLKEYLALMDALAHDVIDMKIDQFYYLSRAALVKDERNLDKFDRVFGHVFKGLESLDVADIAQIPEEWLRALTEKFLSEEEKKLIESMGGWDKLMETLKQRLEEQKKRHEGGNKMIGTGGTSPFGAYGYNPQGIRVGQDKSRNRSAVKVWDQRQFKDYDDSLELGTRNIKVALRRLRRFAREGAEEELDLDNTIHSTAANAACWDTVAGFDVVWDWSAPIALAMCRGAIAQPIRHPVMAYAFATPLITINRSRALASSNADGAATP